jgi:hypothetical protein
MFCEVSEIGLDEVKALKKYEDRGFVLSCSQGVPDSVRKTCTCYESDRKQKILQDAGQITLSFDGEA